MRSFDLVLGGLLVVSGALAGLADGSIWGIEEGDTQDHHVVTGKSKLIDPTVTGNLHVGASSGAFAIEGSGVLEWDLEDIRLDVHSFKRTGGYAGVGYVVTVAWTEEEPTITRYYDNATVRITGSYEGSVAIWPDEGLGNTWFDLDLVPAEDADIHGSAYGATFSSEDDKYRYWMPGPVFGLGHNGSQHRVADAMDVQFERFQANGAIQVLVEHSQLEIVHPEGEDDYRTGYEAASFEPIPIPGQRVTYAVLSIPMANLTVADFGNRWSTFFSPEPVIDAQGTVSFTAMDGEVQSGSSHEKVDGDRIVMEGNATLDLTAHGESDGTENSQGDWGILPIILPEPEIHSSFEAEPEGFTVNGRSPFNPQRPTPSGTSLAEDVTLFSKIAGVLVLVWAIGWRLVPFLLGLYNGNPLENRHRREIRDYLARVGVAHSREIQRHTGIAIGSVAYHLEVLRRCGIIHSVRTANYQAYFLRESGLSNEQMRQLAWLADTTRRDIARMIAQGDRVSQAELVRSLGVTQGAVSRQLCKLVSAGLIHKTRNKKLWYSPSPLLKDWHAKGPRG